MNKYTYLIPVVLAPTAAELSPLGTCPRVLTQVDIALELQHSHGRIVGSLRVKRYIPNTRRSVLRITVSSRVDKVLLRRRVCANESDEIVWIDGLGLEELDEDVCGVFFAGEKTRWPGFGVVLAADEGADARS